MGEKYFVITIDTEGDNQWDLSHECSTLNAKYLPRFQELCEKYGYKPVWLTNYEMAMDDYFVSYMKPKASRGLCEIGMHLHAWFSPPDYEIKRINNERAYLIEYPLDIIDAKVAFLTNLIEERFGIRPTSHRSGRWATNSHYFDVLKKYGYTVDCSATPLVDWSKTPGSTGVPGTDYSKVPKEPWRLESGLLEVPMSIRKLHFIDKGRIHSLRNTVGEVKRFISGRIQWLRPDKRLSVDGLHKLVREVNKENTDVLMFMLHSSELMPGGSPSFPTEESIEDLYRVVEQLFITIQNLGYTGMTLEAYERRWEK